MPATLEPIVTVGGHAHAWIARTGPDHERFGDPYAVACVVVRAGDTTARVEALTAGGDSARMLLGLRDVLRGVGFTAVEWERREAGQCRKVRVAL